MHSLSRAVRFMHQPFVLASVLTARRAQLVSADESDALIITP
jgi:hypothetical protein